jgi:hypothetical protein
MFDLMKCDGPACPQCGCQDAKIIMPATGVFARGVAICNYCGRRFPFTVAQDDTTGSAADDQKAGDQARRRRTQS